MSRRTPWALMWLEHSKPPIQKERNKRLPGFIYRLEPLVGIAVALPVHQPLAKVPFQLVIQRAVRSARGLCNLFDRYLGGPVGEKQSVGLLVSVGELCITETGEDTHGSDHPEQFHVGSRKVLPAAAPRVAPAVALFRIGDAAEFRQHDRLIARLCFQKQQTPAGAFAFEQFWRFGNAVAQPDMLGVAVVI